MGSVDDLIKKERASSDRSLKISRDLKEYEYSPSSGNPRVMRLEMLKLRDKSGKFYYTIIAENRSLLTLCKMGQKEMVSSEEFKIHFQVLCLILMDEAIN